MAMAHFFNNYPTYTINLKLNEYRDIYCHSPFCDGKSYELAPEFKSFLHNKLEKSPQSSYVSLHFHLPANSRDKNLEEEISNSIRSYYLEQINNLLMILDKSYKHIINYVIIASIMMLLGFVLQVRHEKTLFLFILLEALNIIAWVFLWEAIYTFCFRNKKTRYDLKEYKKIYASNILFKYIEKRP